MQRPPMAFMSYAHIDDTQDNGRLTWFREHLSREVRVQTGEEFPIFQDKANIHWGQNWQERINESIDGITFFIPIITPGFFSSQACRAELKRFREREKALKRTDLILPLYYVDCALLNDSEKRAADELAQLIVDHQYADWRELRFEPKDSPKLLKELARLAVQIRDALERTKSIESSNKCQVKTIGSRTKKREGDPEREQTEQSINIKQTEFQEMKPAWKSSSFLGQTQHSCHQPPSCVPSQAHG